MKKPRPGQSIKYGKGKERRGRKEGCDFLEGSPEISGDKIAIFKKRGLQFG